jgi:hypothetical protein
MFEPAQQVSAWESSDVRLVFVEVKVTRFTLLTKCASNRRTVLDIE